MCYMTERRFHTEFGVAQPPLHEWPQRKVDDYTVIMQVIDEVEAKERAEQERKTRASAGGGGARGADPAATEQAYQAMRARALAEQNTPTT